MDERKNILTNTNIYNDYIKDVTTWAPSILGIKVVVSVLLTVEI